MTDQNQPDEPQRSPERAFSEARTGGREPKDVRREAAVLTPERVKSKRPLSVHSGIAMGGRELVEILDSHEALRAQLKAAQEERDEWHRGFNSAQLDYDEVATERDALRARSERLERALADMKRTDIGPERNVPEGTVIWFMFEDERNAAIHSAGSDGVPERAQRDERGEEKET